MGKPRKEKYDIYKSISSKNFTIKGKKIRRSKNNEQLGLYYSTNMETVVY